VSIDSTSSIVYASVYASFERRAVSQTCFIQAVGRFSELGLSFPMNLAAEVVVMLLVPVLIEMRWRYGQSPNLDSRSWYRAFKEWGGYERMYTAESLVVLSLEKIESANEHLVLRKQILTKIEIGQDMRAQTEWQGWRVLVS
jgi:hypothetical protein